MERRLTIITGKGAFTGKGVGISSRNAKITGLGIDVTTPEATSISLLAHRPGRTHSALRETKLDVTQRKKLSEIILYLLTAFIVLIIGWVSTR